MDFFELIKYRHTSRKFDNRQLTDEELKKIILAANSAPVGSRLYKDIHLTVVQNREILGKLGEAAKKRWEDKANVKKIVGENNPDVKRKDYDPFYGAPTVIFISHRKQNLQPNIEFSNVACVGMAMHMAAADMGLGSGFMWFALESMRMFPELDNTICLELPENFEPLLGLTLGYPMKEPEAIEIDNRISLNFVK